MAVLKVGDGLNPETDVGALVNAETRDKVDFFVRDAVDKGAELVLGVCAPTVWAISTCQPF